MKNSSSHHHAAIHSHSTGRAPRIDYNSVSHLWCLYIYIMCMRLHPCLLPNPSSTRNKANYKDIELKANNQSLRSAEYAVRLDEAMINTSHPRHRTHAHLVFTPEYHLFKSSKPIKAAKYPGPARQAQCSAQHLGGSSSNYPSWSSC